MCHRQNGNFSEGQDGNSDSVLQLEQCWIAGEVPLDRYDKGTRTERVQIRSMYSVELAQTGKIERTVI